MTEQEIYNHPEFKLIKRILKREFKWIKDVRLDGDPNTYGSVFFLEIVMDPFECAEEEGLTVAHYIHKNIPEKVMYFSVFFVETGEHPIVSNITNEIEKVSDEVKYSPALPEEYKMKTKKSFRIGDYLYEG